MRKKNKLAFVPVELIQASLIFASKARAYLSVVAYIHYSMGILCQPHLKPEKICQRTV